MSLINTSINGRSAVLSLNNPAKVNALESELVNEAIAFLDECKQKNILTILLKAEPNKHNVWSSGHNIKELPTGERDPLGYFDSLELFLHAVQEYPGPVIAHVRGGVWGGACDLVMTCDLVVADETATFAITPAKIGLPYNISGILHFMNRIGSSQAKEMFFRAKPVDAQTALSWGIINHLFPAADLDAKAQEIIDDISANSPMCIKVIKEQFRILSNASATLSPLTYEKIQGLRRAVYDSHDYHEGITAFLEKRKPVYTGN